MKILLPCCGGSSRFPDLPPKWMLPDHSGRPMIAEAISLLGVSPKDIVVTVLAEHEERFRVVRGLKKSLGEEVEVFVLKEKTKSQSETVFRTIEHLDLREPFLVKDSDNCFKIDTIENDCSYVCYDSLNNHSLINPRNKSYVQLDGHGMLINIKEKQVISDTFSVGGYFFSEPVRFLETYIKLSALPSVEQKELYLSDIILSMLIDGVPFKGNPVTAYQDWGTIHDWKRFLLSRKTFFVALDGYLFEKGSDFFEPTFLNAQPNPNAVRNVLQLRELGHSLIFLSVRSDTHAKHTEMSLAELGLGSIPVVYNCPVSRWELITATSPGIGFRTCDAHELDPVSDVSVERLL